MTESQNDHLHVSVVSRCSFIYNMKNSPYLGDLNFLTTQMFNGLLEVTGSREWRKVGVHVGLVL